MVESMLRIRNLYWADARFQPTVPTEDTGGLTAMLATLRGQFSLALPAPRDTLILVRDPLGVNKLFFAIDEAGTVMAANYLVDLVSPGVPFETVYSVPAGHFVEIDPHGRTLSLRRYFHPDAAARREAPALDAAARRIREHLELWFARLAADLGRRRVCVSLSGGLDSSMVAALATKHFSSVTAYTYGYAGSDAPESEDVRSARRVADFLGVSLRFVPATPDEVLGRERDHRARDRARCAAGRRRGASARPHRRSHERAPGRLRAPVPRGPGDLHAAAGRPRAPARRPGAGARCGRSRGGSLWPPRDRCRPALWPGGRPALVVARRLHWRRGRQAASRPRDRRRAPAVLSLRPDQGESADRRRHRTRRNRVDAPAGRMRCALAPSRL
ncbi:MAG: hypothetical protein E6J24_00225 [Chloroflexi bacterium]|nr:MAG: hypothetical protein E6J24_00225 [Chloroflexota bacterium]